jgi:hypothetical protein
MAILLALPLLSYGQQAASVTWNCVAPDSTRPSGYVGNVTGAEVTGNEFSIRDYTGGNAGPLGTFMRWWPGSGIAWGPETAEVATRWIQFSAAPVIGNAFTVDSVAFHSAGGGTGEMRMNVYYSTDPTFAVKTILNSDSAVRLPHATNVGNIRYAWSPKKLVASGETFYLRIYPYYAGASSTSKYIYTQAVVIKGTTTSSTDVDGSPLAVPEALALNQNYPNPFNPGTTISYAVAQESSVRLEVFDLLGRSIATLVNDSQAPGVYSVRFDASRFGSGAYVYRLTAGTQTFFKTMMLLK